MDDLAVSGLSISQAGQRQQASLIGVKQALKSEQAVVGMVGEALGRAKQSNIAPPPPGRGQIIDILV